MRPQETRITDSLLQLKNRKIKSLSLAEDQKAKAPRRYFSNEELLQRYSVSMRKRHISKLVQDRSKFAVKDYFTFLESIKHKTIYKANGGTLPKYLDYLKKRNLAINTQTVLIRCVSAFYSWLICDDIIGKKNMIFLGFCTNEHIETLKKTYIPCKNDVEPSPIRKEMLDYIQKFCVYRLNKGHSGQGLRSYRQELKIFTVFLEDETEVSSIRDITKHILLTYQTRVFQYKKPDGQPYAQKSVQGKLIAIKQFFRFLVKYDYLEKDPSTVIDLPRLDRGLPTALMSQEELEALVNAPDLKTPRGLRDRTVMETLFSSGIRNAELCHIKIEDINLDEGLVKITHAKGGLGFQRVVPVGKVACAFIKKYLKESREILLGTNEDDNYLFLNNFGTRLRRMTVINYISAYRSRCNIKNKITAHSFRVTCATEMLRNGADVRYIQQQLGHRSLRSTQIYTRVFPKDLKKVHSKTHPREKNLQKYISVFA